MFVYITSCRINDSRQHWKNIIARIQSLDNIDHSLYICQFHFDPNDLIHGQNKITLRKNAIPM